jgi:hypothetical protein
MEIHELINQGAKFARQGHWPVDKFIKLGTMAEMNLEQYQIDATDWEEHDGKCICGKLQYDGDIEITIDHGHYTWLSIGRMSNGTHYLCASGDDEATAEITYCPFCGKKLV